MEVTNTLVQLNEVIDSAKKIELLFIDAKKLHQRLTVGLAHGNFCCANVYIIQFKGIYFGDIDGVAALYTCKHR